MDQLFERFFELQHEIETIINNHDDDDFLSDDEYQSVFAALRGVRREIIRELLIHDGKMKDKIETKRMLQNKLHSINEEYQRLFNEKRDLEREIHQLDVVCGDHGEPLFQQALAAKLEQQQGMKDQPDN